MTRLSASLLACVLASTFAPDADADSHGSVCNGQGCGVVFAIDPNSGDQDVLYSFSENGTDGHWPSGKLSYINDLLYGVTSEGGTSGLGTVFSVRTDTGAEAVVYSFQPNPDGWSPAVGMKKTGGMLYGVTGGGGNSGCHGNGCGTVFSLNPATGAETVLYAFMDNGKDAIYPDSKFTAVGSLFYGASAGGGGTGCNGNGCGTIYSFNPTTNSETVLYSFKGGDDGASPDGQLLPFAGKLYGVTPAGGGAYNYGTAFSVDPESGAEAVLYRFHGESDGNAPYGALIKVDGQLYGTTCYGGTNNFGTVYSLDPINGAEHVVYSFRGPPADGRCPLTGLTTVGKILYGTTSNGGKSDLGTVFALTKSGKERYLFSFDGNNGGGPGGELRLVHGKLYGVAVIGGSNFGFDAPRRIR